MNKKNLTVAILISLALSSIVFAWYRDWIIIAIPSKKSVTQKNIPAKISKKKVSLFFRKKIQGIGATYERETKEVLWTEYQDKNIFTLIQSWASLMDEENLLQKKTIVQAVALDERNNECIVSFDRPPFNKYDAAFKKYICIESLLKTLSEEFNQIQAVRFLVHHQPIHDEHLDFSQPWPIHSGTTNTDAKKSFSTVFRKKPSLIVIDPIGDAHRVGRTIDDVFERSITMRCAQELKRKLQEMFPAIQIYLSRYSGDTVEPLQNAVFANRLDADLYISLSCYKEQTNTPHLSLITFSYEPDYDRATHTMQKKPTLSLVPLHKAYREYLPETHQFSNAMHSLLNSPEYKNKIAIEQLRTFPYKPLLGVNTIAIGIEFGLPKKDDWNFLTAIIATALQKLLAQS